MYKEDLALSNLQWLMCHKTQPNQLRTSALCGHWMQSRGAAMNDRQPGWIAREKVRELVQSG